MLQHLVARHEIGVRPRIQPVHAERDRQEEQRHDRQHARRGANRPAQHDAPRAAGQLMHHAEREAAERHAEAEHVRHQVRLQELREVQQRAND